MAEPGTARRPARPPRAGDLRGHRLICGDGADCHPAGGPYDRLIVTAGRDLPAAVRAERRPRPVWNDVHDPAPAGFVLHLEYRNTDQPEQG